MDSGCKSVYATSNRSTGLHGDAEPHSWLNTRLASNTGERISGALVSTISRSVKRSSSQNLEVDVSLSYARALVATLSRAGPGSLRVKYVGVYVR